MAEIQQWGIAFILALQSHQSPFLDSFFYVITQFGGFAYILVIPLIVWCIEPRMGLRTLLAMVIAQYLVILIKDIVQEPRPYIADPRIVSDGEHGFSFPSGHAMGSMVFYGLLILWTDQRWLRWLLTALIILIGLSRNYLGVHYPHDVIVGWLLGMIYLVGWVYLQRITADNLHYMSFSRQILWSVVAPAIIATIHYYVFGNAGVMLIAGAVSAGLLCLILDRKKPLMNASGSVAQKTGRYVVGIALTLAVFAGLKYLYPAEDLLFYNPILWLNGALLTFVIGYLVPKLFAKIKLA